MSKKETKPAFDYTTIKTFDDACKKLNTYIRWLMTGTPVQNSKQDYYNLCNALGFSERFYIKDENKILLMYKSYIPLVEAIEPRLPFWEYMLEHPDIKKKFDDVFEFNDNLCIIRFSI
jgi:SNF2 family DNA or RNA helicase